MARSPSHSNFAGPTMQKLIAQLIRLYLPAEAVLPTVLASHLSGQHTVQTSLTTIDGMTRAMVVPFDKLVDGDDAGHWRLLCQVANALQAELGLPPPAVSITGDQGYALWLSLETPVPVGLAQQFVQLVRRAYGAHIEPGLDVVTGPVELPPCVHRGSGRWAAFIHPGLGASFADESGLEMAPPLSGQVALLEHLDSISESKFMHALKLLQHAHGEVELASEPAPVRAPTPAGLLLQDATLEDIVRHLHARHIEPTFRHLIAK